MDILQHNTLTELMFWLMRSSLFTKRDKTLLTVKNPELYTRVENYRLILETTNAMCLIKHGYQDETKNFIEEIPSEHFPTLFHPKVVSFKYSF